MSRINYPLLTICMLAVFAAAADVQAQVFYFPSTSPRVVPQNGAVYRTPNRVYRNNGLQYQSYRPSYGQPTVYSNPGYAVQPYRSYTQSAPTYYVQPSTPYYHEYSNSQPVYSSDQIYSSQPSTAYRSNYGSGFYDSPQQAANASCLGLCRISK